MPPPAFKRIGKTFKIAKKKYYGMAIASPEAIYLIMMQGRNDTALALLGAGLGAAGSAIAGAIAEASARKKQPFQTCTLGELERTIRARPHAGWPLRFKRKNAAKPVFVVPRGSVDLIEHPAWSNLLKLTLDDAAITIEYLLFRGGGIRDYLMEAGWPLKWRGEMLRPQRI